MKAKLPIILSLTLAINVYAGSATWNLNPESNDWNTATNWTPNTIPNRPSDVATFAVSNTTALFLSAATKIGATNYSAGASAFTTTVPGTVSLTLSGDGITNSSGVIQNFVADASSSGGGSIIFMNSATSSVLTTFNIRSSANPGYAGGSLIFDNTSSAGESLIINDGPRGDKCQLCHYVLLPIGDCWECNPDCECLPRAFGLCRWRHRLFRHRDCGQ